MIAGEVFGQKKDNGGFFFGKNMRCPINSQNNSLLDRGSL